MIVDIGPVAHGGHCVARAEGRVIFVRHALPGERVRIEITDRRAKFWRADAVEILEPSPDRVEAPCRFAGRCGGCDFQHADPRAQLDLKTAVLREQLTRLGGLSADEVAGFAVEALPGGALGWRTRVQYAVDRTGRAGLREHHSHRVVHIDECVIADERVRSAGLLRQRWRGSNVLGVVAGDADELSVYTQRDRRGQSRMVSGPRAVTQTVQGRQFTLDADAFWQVHPAAADTLSRVVADLATPGAGQTIWDLYAGAGLFAAALAPGVGDSGTVVAVESDRRGRAADNLADLPRAEVRYGDVAALLSELPDPDTVVADPPRTGLGADLVDALAAADPRTLIYVACDPAALARDLKSLASHEYRLTALRAFDAFPMTHHFETVARFER
ncbi:MAG TPA: TRAM domain-containing protein [Stackebrandtia sp.]|jgi:tRNA/tmRNA/rRNA uracil-C5-methylase (TrmA/RlmC/RlmD family)|uniref:class I SAM-dependent RNA methyltransferase n=1 Tax=Stackebrandtia sp. TaxID=2023065 RepID=UPI002D32539A|nr:TRAM domain-containing protein [Stackebrandtia sp.]HZE37262.1 TRAM domain-containing protein [Stackebrandtia sp.]